MNKLNIKMAFLIGVLSFFVAFGIGEYSNIVTTKHLQENSGQAMLKLTKNIANTLDREMLERYREIKFAATLYPLNSEKSTKKERREFIEKIKNNYNHHEWIGFALPDGTVDVGTNGYLEGKNAKARPWHPGGLKGPYIGDVHDALLLAKLLPNTTGEAIYFSDVAFPVKDSQGKTLAVLCTHLTWQWTRDMIRSIEKEHNVDIFLLSKDGLVLVGPGDSERKEIASISQNISSYLNENKQSSFSLIDWKKDETYLTAKTISEGFQEYKGFNWQVVVRQPIKDAFKKSHDHSDNLILASITIGILGAIIGIIFSSKISAPISELNNIVTKLAKGEKIDFQKSKSTDEIGNLHNALKNFHDNFNTVSTLKNDAQDKINLSLQVFDQSIEGILITDKNNNAILANKSFEKITGYSQEDIFGKNPSLLNSGSTPKEFYDELWSTLLKDGKWEGYVFNKRKDGSLYKEYLRISSLKDKNGDILNYVATFVGVEELLKEII